MHVLLDSMLKMMWKKPPLSYGPPSPVACKTVVYQGFMLCCALFNTSTRGQHHVLLYVLLLSNALFGSQACFTLAVIEEGFLHSLLP